MAIQTFRVVVLLPTVTVMLLGSAGGMDTGGIEKGIRTLIWKAPVGSVGAEPAYSTSAGIPSILTLTGTLGFEKGVEISSAPSGNAGKVRPSPVPQSETTVPRRAGFSGPFTDPS